MNAATYTISVDNVGGQYNGRILSFERYATGPAHKVVLIDDDGITYYTGVARVADADLDDLVNDLYDWGAYDSGTTQLRLDGKDTIS